MGTPLREHGTVKSVAFNTDGRRILTGSEDGSVRFWNLATDRSVGRSIRHDDPVGTASYGAGNLRILTEKDGVLQLRDGDTAEALPRMLGDAPRDLRATGTCDSTASLGEHPVEQLDGECWRRWATRGEKDGGAKATQRTGDSESQPVALARNKKSRQSVATAGERRRARDSNPQPTSRHLISSQGPTPEIPEKTQVPENGGASGGAVEREADTFDVDLRAVVGAWKHLDGEARAAIQSIVDHWTFLPEVVRDGVLAMVKAASTRNASSTGKGT